MIGWRTVFVGTMLLLVSTASAAEASPPERWAGLTETMFQNYGQEQGLPPPIPTALAQDSDGFMWVGTQGGLIRWDGYRLLSYQPEPGVPGSLPGGWIAALHTDPHGTLWIGTDGDGLARYDRDHDRFVPVPLGDVGIGRSHIGTIVDDAAGGLWVGTDDGLYHLDGIGQVDVALHHEVPSNHGLPDDRVHAVLRDRQGRLWIGTDQGLARREAGAARFDPVALGASVIVSALFEDTEGRIWIGTTQHGLYAIDPGATKARPVDETDGARSTLRTDRVAAISAAGEHEIWVGMRAAGIVAIDTLSGRTRRIRHDRVSTSTLIHDDVWTVTRDRAGSMWVGSAAGLSYHPKNSGAVSVVLGGSDRPNGVSQPDISSILAARDGRIWLGFLVGGADIIDPLAGRVARLQADPSRPDAALPPDLVTEMAEAGNGDVYVGTVRGLYRVSGLANEVGLVTLPPRDPHAMTRTVLVDQDVLWVGGLNNGLQGTRLDGGAVVFGAADSARLTDQSVFTLLRGAGRDLWIGTYNGLNRLDPVSHAVEQILPDPLNPTALPARIVSTLLIDRQGRLWVGTFGGGIAVMVGRTPGGVPRFHRLGIMDGLPQLNIDKLLLDAEGNVWASTDDGLAVIDPASFKIHVLRRADGANLDVFWVKSGATDIAGEPLFGAKGGMTVVRPGWPADWTLEPPVVVSDVRIGGHPVPSGRLNGGDAVPPLVLTPDTNSLAVEFSALDFSAPERNLYSYRLDGFDRGWIDTDASRRLAAYTNLPPGDYSLRLRGSNRSGVWAEKELAIPVHVVAAWYQTWWFELAAALAGLALIAAVIGSRTALLRRRQAQLERQIAERTADLQAANAQLFELATIDQLTGCFNRRHFIARADELVALAQRHATPLSLTIIDIDHFKRVNDTYGHPVGDELLRAIARQSRGLVRATDLFGRMGGEEFALMMPHTAVDGALLFANRLRQLIGGMETRIGDATIRVTVSLGVAELAGPEDFTQLYARADAALYAAKAAGRDRVVVDPAA